MNKISDLTREDVQIYVDQEETRRRIAERRKNRKQAEAAQENTNTTE